VLATVAAGEAFHGLQRATYHPATIVGLLAVPSLVVGSYLFGPKATVVVLAGATVTTGLWFLRRRASDELVVDASATVFVIVWVGVLASFAGLLLSPSAHPHRHGVAFVAAALALAVAHDVGSYAVGSRFGRHLIAPRLSPSKTLEGLIGGTVVDLVVAAAIISRIHPLGMGVALGLGAFVAVFAPLGDLLESAVKRDLGLKDMGNLLPAHGGVLDRVDAMLFVLPAAWCLFRLANLT
jgi:phosphatidate cytidylyltransferase